MTLLGCWHSASPKWLREADLMQGLKREAEEDHSLLSQSPVPPQLLVSGE